MYCVCVRCNRQWQVAVLGFLLRRVGKGSRGRWRAVVDCKSRGEVFWINNECFRLVYAFKSKEGSGD
ncbi:hypothetical protein DPMN_012872 [Dreissena polymorpha]|uniref:Uncharacterized protein n=1 Tax=Dreissena polymorpha TaxID=45954 RepID=A0A9D4N387_DREPO|nr:hypothetical protein DPMN_012872 [Dreissena polymorpha]